MTIGRSRVSVGCALTARARQKPAASAATHAPKRPKRNIVRPSVIAWFGSPDPSRRRSAGQGQSTNVDFGTQKKPRPIGKIDRGPVRKTASGGPSGRRRNVQTSRLLKLPNIVHRGLSLVS